MDYKSKIVRYKSDSITDSEIRSVHKICKSSKVQEQAAKKRGVYVERFSNTVIGNERTKKSPVPLRPGEKKFLDSVLTILSKSSNGTQYPEANLKNKTNTKLNKKSKPKNKTRIAKINQIKAETLNIPSPNDVTNTPPAKSSKVKMKLDLFRLDSRSTKTDTSNTRCDMERLGKEISFGNIINNESMAETADFDKVNKKVYDICADLLESTLSAHDENNITESPNGFQMNEPDTDQLNNKKPERNSTQFKTNSSKVIYIDNETKLLKNAKPIEKAARYTKKPLLQKSEKVEMRNGSRKRYKQNFITYLKQQLQMDNLIFQEPHSFFETLKLIIRNKKKAAISFNCRKAEQGFIDSKECMYKNPKVASKNKNKNKKSNRSLRHIPSTFLDFSTSYVQK